MVDATPTATTKIAVTATYNNGQSAENYSVDIVVSLGAQSRAVVSSSREDVYS